MTTDWTGQELGGYQVLEQIGQGRMAVVYKAYQPSLERHVALKVLNENLSAEKQLVERFLREARAAAKLEHPNIIKIYNVAREGNLYCIAMHYVAGGSLADKLKREGALSPRTALSILREVGAGLDHAHARGIVHRDVKPSNILLTAEGHAILSDFGIAKAAAESRLTQTGMVVGTPEYMSPEQAEGTTVDTPSDLYSLGVVLYEMLTGRVPFEADTPLALLYKHVHEPPPPPSRAKPAMSQEVEAVVLRSLEKGADSRYSSAREMADDLAAALAVPATPGRQAVAGRLRRPSLVGGRSSWIPLLAGLAGLVLILAAWAARSPAPTAQPTPAARPSSTAEATPQIAMASTATAVQPTTTPTLTRTPRPTATPEPTPLQETVLERDGSVLLYVPPGEFLMGADERDTRAHSNEKPQRTVHLDGYYVGRTEVTNAQFEAFIRAGGYTNLDYWTDQGWRWKESAGVSWPYYWHHEEWNRPDQPVVGVSWYEAAAYAKWAGARLPSEAEWEKAARGTDGRVWPWGDVFEVTAANTEEGGLERTEPVASYPSGASPYGALDMSGNIGEWVADWYDETYYGNAPLSNPAGPTSGAKKVLRGGAWYFDQWFARSSFRYGLEPTTRELLIVGFRLAR